MSEPIEKIIERCRSRIDLSLDCNVSDILALIEEIEKHQQKKTVIAYPAWYGMGSGD